MTTAPYEASGLSAAAPSESGDSPSCFALLGNPNTGKTTLFNRLCGLRAKTANFPGSTVEARVGVHVDQTSASGERITIVDLPGIYGLSLDRPESCVCRDYLAGRLRLERRPQAVVVVADATNLSRNLIFVSQALQQGLPAVVALNMIDLAQRRGLTNDVSALADRLGVPVVPICARTGAGIDALECAMHAPVLSRAQLPDPTDARAAGEWADHVVEEIVGGDHSIGAAADTLTDRLDAAFTHPILGVLVFLGLMTGLFYTIFALASVPMDLIDLLFAWLGEFVGRVIPPGAIHDLLVGGVIGGVSSTVVFLPQICLLFFLISLLEDTGYMARAAFVMDRIMRRFGLPGQAFVPMLSAHACAIPAIMSARLIPDHRDRLATILVTPFLSCSARLPVYVLLISLLFADSPLYAGLAFAGCYALGAGAALISAWIARRTFLRGPSRPMVLELPTYKMPSIRSALLVTFDRAVLFLRKAGTVILAICIVLWWLRSYPVTPDPVEVVRLRDQAVQMQAADAAAAQEMANQADAMSRRAQIEGSFAGKIGRTIEPVFEPLGYNWQLSVGVLTSFAAREVFVATMSVLLTGAEEADDPAVIDRITSASRSDGTPVFTTATSASLLVFYVLAMQCLPTLAVTRRETGSWSWALLQLGYMTAVAYLFALATYQGLRALGVT